MSTAPVAARLPAGLRRGTAAAIGPATAPWPLGVAGFATAVIGVQTDAVFLVLAGGAAVLWVLIARAPEAILATYLVAGPLKGAPWLAALPVDATIASAGALVVAMVVHRRGLVPESPLARIGMLLAVILAAIVAASVLWSPDPAAGLDKTLRFELLVGLAFLAPFVLLSSRAALMRFSLSMVAFGLIAALTAERTDEPSQPLIVAGGNEISLGLFTGIGIIIVLGYLVTELRPLMIVPGLVAVVVMAQALLVSGSRGGLVATAVALVFCVVHQLMRPGRSRKTALAMVAGLVSVILIAGPSLFGEATAKYERQLFSTDVERVLGGRSNLLRHGWDIALSHPFGAGARGYPVLTEGDNYPHNILLELWSEHGILAMAVFVVLVGVAWAVRRADGVRGKSPESALIGALVIFNLIEAMVSFDLTENRLLFFALGLALVTPAIVAERMRSAAATERAVAGDAAEPMPSPGNG